MEKAKAFLVEARTGCTCCSRENHYRGPYKTRSEAESAIVLFKSIPLVASQYSKTGQYVIEEHDAEILPDGRLIVQSRVLDGFCEDTGSDYIGEM